MKLRSMKCQLEYSWIAIMLFVVACNFDKHETSKSISDETKYSMSYLFQDTSIKRYLFEGGYEGAILQTYRKENKMFPYSTSHTRLKVSLTEDSTFVVNYLFFKNGRTVPDTVIYFLRRDHPENSYYLKKEPLVNGKILETKVALAYLEREVLILNNKNYEKFRFESKDSEMPEFHFWSPDIGIIKLESKVYNKSFVLSFGSDDFRTKIITDILITDSSYNKY